MCMYIYIHLSLSVCLSVCRSVGLCVCSASFQGISWIVFIHVFQGVRPHIFIKYKYIQANRARIRKNSLKRMDSFTFSFVNLLGLKWSVSSFIQFLGQDALRRCDRPAGLARVGRGRRLCGFAIPRTPDWPDWDIKRPIRSNLLFSDVSHQDK